jgi:hypothetical protein
METGRGIPNDRRISLVRENERARAGLVGPSVIKMDTGRGWLLIEAVQQAGVAGIAGVCWIIRSTLVDKSGQKWMAGVFRNREA